MPMKVNMILPVRSPDESGVFELYQRLIDKRNIALSQTFIFVIENIRSNPVHANNQATNETCNYSWSQWKYRRTSH
jgi:hypothetical protein